ncbi:2-hydroxychromene-2-carboxylate isomerase [Hoeflea sp. TYP-13]|uniref:2-hydroxychromene-2-carboxylate isomerase n=1 Tax=Hoeflea sp. TYP-13 TaxID=3230023 RepID=UPI0034C6AF82
MIEVYFDFVSPYAYFSLNRLDALAARHGLQVSYRPILLWAVRRALKMSPPMDDEPKGTYLLDDMARSARFFGLPYRMPDAFPISTHLAARAYYGLAAIDPLRLRPFMHSVFDAYFTQNQDISDEDVLRKIGGHYGLDPETLTELMTGDGPREALVLANDDAVARGVWGSPFVFIDDEAFFGADRLPQIEWHLASRGQGAEQPGAHNHPRRAGADNGI